MDDVERQCWDRWRTQRDISARNQLFESYQRWSELEAASWYRKICSQGAESGDFMGFAYVGLLESIDRFDPALGNMFKTYARHRIRGSILTGVLERNYQLIYQSEYADDFEEATAGRHIETENIDEAIVELAIIYLIQSGRFENGIESTLNRDAMPETELGMLRERLLELVARLREPLRSIVKLHYLRGISFTAISEMLNLSKGRVSQLHSEAIKELRRKLSG